MFAKKIFAPYVVLATGGVGGVYEHSTNYRILTGDGVAVCIRRGVLKTSNPSSAHLFTIDGKCSRTSFSSIPRSVYEHSTNYRILTGDGVAVCIRRGVEVENIDYVQIHPTTLYTERKQMRFFECPPSRVTAREPSAFFAKSTPIEISPSITFGEDLIMHSTAGGLFSECPARIVSAK